MLIFLFSLIVKKFTWFLSFYCLFKREIFIKSRNWPFSPYFPWMEHMQEKPRTHPFNLIWRRFAFTLENNEHHASQNLCAVDVSVGEVETGLLRVPLLFPQAWPDPPARRTLHFHDLLISFEWVQLRPHLWEPNHHSLTTRGNAVPIKCLIPSPYELSFLGLGDI